MQSAVRSSCMRGTPLQSRAPTQQLRASRGVSVVRAAKTADGPKVSALKRKRARAEFAAPHAIVFQALAPVNPKDS